SPTELAIGPDCHRPGSTRRPRSFTSHCVAPERSLACRMNARFQSRATAAGVICLGLGIVLSHFVEPGVVRIEKLTLAGGTPAIRFFPTDSEVHPIALMAHGVTASK